MRSEMVKIPEGDFIYTFDQVAASQDSHMDKENGLFALAEIPIDKVLAFGKSVVLTKEEIEENDDTEYIEALVQAVKAANGNPFPPVVVIDQGYYYEWIDGAHRMTALHLAGVEQVTAYVMNY